MGATVVLRQSNVQVQPGGRATLDVGVTNNGTIVDQFTISVVGDAGPWAEAEPPTLSLFPGEDGSATIVFQPPRSSRILSGRVPFGVRVASKEDPEGSAVEEGVLDIGEFVEVGAELVPQGVTGRKKGRADLAVDNRGNRPVMAQLRASDPDDILQFELDPATMTAQPGTANFSKVKVKAPRRFFRGATRSFPFDLWITAEGQADPTVVHGTFLQKPVLPGWLPRAVMALLALLLIGVLAWFFLLKPSVETTAKDAVEGPLAAQDQKINDQAAQNAAQQDALNKLSEGTGVPIPSPPPAPAPSPAPAGSALGDPIDGRLFTAKLTGQPPGTDNTQNQSGIDNAFQVPAGRTLSITDLVISNPDAGGDNGTVSVIRDGQVLLQLRLENFRDIDYHFVSPVVVGPDKRLRLSVSCNNTDGDDCNVALYWAGFLR